MKARGMEELELRISLFLRAGVVIAGVLLLAGWLMSTRLGGHPLQGLETYQPHDLGLILREAWSQGRVGTLLCYGGLFALISLPIVRVLLTAVLFLRQKDLILSGVAFFVLACLALSFFLGAVH
ncbi:MAG: DUF1634 domain-containing protein [Bdellovibrionaceae bacterium]|nr:DUF1634 domain-containing protein [Pseudobdellovibrionaceae bacterium]MBX3034890.1 DUF1634 domain-containing protein [Pseudobdellovibrionaceae bacterium]